MTEEGGTERRQHGSTPLSDALSEYRRRKLDLAELIREGMNLAEERRDEDRSSSARELLARLAEDRFQLAVVGQFSRGKSTLINAILGHSYLPMGALPMTSVVTTVGYGSRPRAVVRRTETSHAMETSVEELARFVARESPEREGLGVASVDIEVPAELLRLGFRFIDTPGVGSAIAANTATTRRFLPDADAVIFVTSFDAPLGEPELQFLDEVKRHVEKLFFVINKLDLVSEAEAGDVVRFVGDRVFGRSDGESRAFAISARGALAAKVRGNSSELTASGLPELERTLVRFLTTEKARYFLLRMSDRAERLLAHQKLDVELGRSAGSGAAHEGAIHRKRFEERVAALLEQERRVAADLAEHIGHEVPGALLEKRHAWSEELASLLQGALKEGGSSATGPTARVRVEAARSRFEESGQHLVDAWLDRRLPEIRSLLVSLAEVHIDRMTSLNEVVERAGAEVFGLPFPEPQREPNEWSSVEFPRFAVGRVVLTIRLRLPWRSSVSASRLEEEAHRLLGEGLAQTAVTTTDAAQHAVVEAAARWAESVGAEREREILEAADRVRTRLGTPTTDQDVRALAEIGRRLAAFRAQVAAWDVDTAAHDSDGMEVTPGRSVSDPTGTMARCTICEQLGHVSFRYMAQAQRDLATRRERRAEHVRSTGFCPMHTWQYAEMASDLGVSLGYADLAEAAAALLRSAELDASTEQELGSAVAQLLAGPERCAACLALAEAERAAVLEIVQELPENTDEESPAPALCVFHTAAVLAANPGLERGRRLVKTIADSLERASEDMRAYSLKRESLRRRLLTAEEESAYLRVISYLAGNPDLVRSRRRDNGRHLFASRLMTPRRSRDQDTDT